MAGSGTVTSWNWNFGDAVSGSNTAVIQHPSHTYTAPGTYQVTLIVSNNVGCSDTIIKSVKVRNLPVVDFSFTTGCVQSLSLIHI